MKIAATVGALSIIVVLLAIWLWTPDRERNALESIYAQSPTDFVVVLGSRIHVRDTGPRDAPAIVMLHGFGASLHSWDAWATVLSDRYRVIRYDLPGAGLTGADPGGDYSDARGAVILVGLLDHFRIPHATLVGHSMGGRLAWRFAAEHDARVDKLVLIAPDGFAIADGEYGKTPEVSAVLKLLPYVFPRLAARQSLQPAYANPDLLSDELLTRYYELILAPGVRKAMIAKLEQSVLSDPVPLLKRIAAPTLLIWGDQDAMIPITNAKDYLKALPAATLITIAGSGHLPHEEASEKSLVAVKEFLDK